MKKYFSLLLLLFVPALFSGVRGNVSMIVQEYSFEHGLPHNSVYAAMKDQQGLMWFATWYGLSSFDGVKFHRYNTRDDFNTDIPPHKLQNIVEANANSIWVKTIDHKLFLFDKKTESYYDVFNEIKRLFDVSPKIIKIQKAADGSLLMLTKNRDLLKAIALDNGKIDVKLLYDPEQNNERRSVSGNLLIEDKDNISWIGTDYKIFNCRKGELLRSKPADFIGLKLGTGSQSEFSCAYHAGNTIWLGDHKGNISVVDYHTGKIIRKQVFPGKTILNITSIYGKNIFVSIPGGIYELNENLDPLGKIMDLGPGETPTNAVADSYDKLWFVIRQNMIVFYDPVNKLSKRFRIPEGRVIPDIKINDGKELGMFFLTTSGEVVWFDRQTVSMVILNDLKDLKQDGVTKYFFNLLLDKDNILWLTSTSQGVFRVSFPRRQFNLISIPGSNGIDEDGSVKHLYQAKDGDIWVATRKPAVYRLDRNGKVKQVFSDRQNYSFGSVYHIMEDRSGNMWFSTKGRGLVRAVPDSKAPSGFVFTRFVNDERDPSSISGNDVYYTYEDSRGHIWVALFGGGLNLFSEESGKVRFYNKNNSFDLYPKYGLYMEVRSITEDKSGRIWVGTSDGLMSLGNNFKYPNQIKFEIYRNDLVRSNVSDNDIYVLYRDAEGQIWISVFGGGLNKLESYDVEQNRPVFKSFSMNEGLNSDIVLSIVEDDDGYLWLATENSIARFDKGQETFRNFDRYDGFIDVRMEEESVIRCLSGDLWFGSRMGILAFNPQKIETYNCDYQTLIVDFLVSNKELNSFKDKPILRESIRYANSITLKHNQNNFVIEFAALNYYNLNRVSYKYILQDYETEWHYNGKNRIASYPNVPPGKYKFVVQTIDEANADLKSERELWITILPPWWRSWWAYLIYTILGILAVYATIKLILFTIKMRNDVYIEQKVSEMKIRFFTNISHELRTPLTLITGPVHELKEKESLTEKGQQYISLIEKSARQMLQLVNQILDFRKLQHGKMVLHVSHLDLKELIGSFMNEFEVLSEEKNISYNFSLSEDEILVWADKERLEIVIRNIISNAFKFTEPGGSIFVTTGLTGDHQRCFVRIEDTGVGIPQNKIAEIFERFSQGENNQGAYYQGTGIGLHLSKEIVNLHHGNISVERKPDKGSIFTIELLLGKEHFNTSEVSFYLGDDHEDAGVLNSIRAELSGEEAAGNENLPVVLVVEDNKDLCRLLKLQLEDKFRVLIAFNGQEGFKKALVHHPDLVITDLMMPGMNGIEMLQEIRKNIQVSHIPVIILTAKQNEEAKIEATSMGANAYITKPFNKEYLIARIEQLLRDRKMFRERIWNQETVVEGAAEENYENYLVKKDVQLLEKIHQVIGENIPNPDYNIDAIAESLGFSRSAFFKKLKSLTGLAPVDLIKEIRLNKSVELLKNTDMTISEIAFEVGFKEAGYYGKCFRKKYHQTPTEFMNVYRIARNSGNGSDVGNS